LEAMLPEFAMKDEERQEADDASWTEGRKDSEIERGSDGVMERGSDSEPESEREGEGTGLNI